LVIFVAGAADAPRDGKASSDAVSTGAGADEPLILLTEEVDDTATGAGADPSEGNGSGAPSRPCRWEISRHLIWKHTS